MYEDLIVTFHVWDSEVVATVWRREFPEGRQRRREVASYTLGPTEELGSPGALLLALHAALQGKPDYVV